jgi:hypothetical protein
MTQAAYRPRPLIFFSQRIRVGARRNHDRVRRDGNQNLACVGWLYVGSIDAYPRPIRLVEPIAINKALEKGVAYF